MPRTCQSAHSGKRPVPHQVAARPSHASAVHFYVFPVTPVIRHGSASLKATYLPSAARGSCWSPFGVTEPGAGTDTSRITTSAQRQGDGWVVHGQKVWTTNAQNAQRILLLAEPHPGGPTSRWRA